MESWEQKKMINDKCRVLSFQKTMTNDSRCTKSIYDAQFQLLQHHLSQTLLPPYSFTPWCLPLAIFKQAWEVMGIFFQGWGYYYSLKVNILKCVNMDSSFLSSLWQHLVWTFICSKLHFWAWWHISFAFFWVGALLSLKCFFCHLAAMLCFL